MATRAKTKEETTVESLREELARLRERLTNMEAELSRPLPGVSWDVANEGVLIDEIAKVEKRRSGLPALIRAGRIKEAQLELQLYKLEIVEAEEAVTEAYKLMEERQKALEEAQRVAGQARGAWHGAREIVGEYRRKIDRSEKKLWSLQHTSTHRERASGPPSFLQKTT